MKTWPRIVQVLLLCVLRYFDTGRGARIGVAGGPGFARPRPASVWSLVEWTDDVVFIALERRRLSWRCHSGCSRRCWLRPGALWRRRTFGGGYVVWASIWLVRHSCVSMLRVRKGARMEEREGGRKESPGLVEYKKSSSEVDPSQHDSLRFSRRGEGPGWDQAEGVGCGWSRSAERHPASQGSTRRADRARAPDLGMARDPRV